MSRWHWIVLFSVILDILSLASLPFGGHLGLAPVLASVLADDESSAEETATAAEKIDSSKKSTLTAQSPREEDSPAMLLWKTALRLTKGVGTTKSFFRSNDSSNIIPVRSPFKSSALLGKSQLELNHPAGALEPLRAEWKIPATSLIVH